MENIESKVRQAFQIGVSDGSKASYDILAQLVIKFGSDVVKQAMRRQDPDRLVWDAPAQIGETGMHGYPLAGGIFTFCSDVYGHDIYVPEVPTDEANAFIEACRRGYEDGRLHDTGHVVVVKETRQIGFLVTVQIEDTTDLSEETLAAMSASCGAKISGLSWPRTPESGGREFACLTSMLTDPAQFDLVDDIVRAIYDADSGFQASFTNARPLE
jgi:hypothetical protein